MAKIRCAFNTSRQTFINLGVRVADTPWTRLRGLLGRMRLRTDEGLWLIPSRGIHTFGLLFPIDVIYLDSDLRVVHLIEGLRPMRIGPLRRRSASVLELPARTIEATGTRVGDSILIRPPAALWEVWANEETRKDWAGERAGLRTYYGSQG